MSGDGQALDRLTLVAFGEFLGQPFRVESASGAVVGLELREAVALRAYPAARTARGRTEPFALRFRGPLGFVLSQGIHRLANDRLGPLDLFLVPIGPDSHGPRYEVIFN